ncbi:endospore germination permease [Paenibacillus filicis]|uniref:Endospore germination permease n=1 Tax=Paenibacillus filicis TaxID=669464 RepID=A0ABU9DIW1_9BACL
MNNHAAQKITLLQFIFIIFGVQISLGVLSLPQDLAERANTDGWITIIILWIISLTASLVVIQVMKKQPEKTLPDLIKAYLGHWVGKAGAVLYGSWVLFYAYAGIVRSILYTKAWLLPQTPNYLIMILFLVPTYVIASGGLRIIGRYAELIFYMSLWVPLVYLIPLREAHWNHLLPILKEGWGPIFSALPVTYLSFSGFGAALILYPFLTNKEKASIGIVISSTLSMVTLVFTTLVCFVIFSPDEITQFNEPIVNVLKIIEFKFIERIEILFFSFFLFLFSLSWISTLYLSVYCASWLFGRQHDRVFLRLFCVIIAAGTFFFLPTFNQSDQMSIYLNRFGMGVELVVPICLLIYMWLHDHYQRRSK